MANEPNTPQSLVKSVKAPSTVKVPMIKGAATLAAVEVVGHVFGSGTVELGLGIGLGGYVAMKAWTKAHEERGL